MHFSQTLEWAKAFSGHNDDRTVQSLAVSPSGKVAMVGIISNASIEFKQGFFLYVTDNAGNLLWGDTIAAKPGSSIAGLSFGNEQLYFATNINDSAFVDGTLKVGGSIILIYTPNGAKSMEKIFPSGTINDLCAVSADDFFMLLTITDTATFYSQLFMPKGVSDLAVVRVQNGALVMVKQMTTNGNGLQLKVSKNKNVFVFAEHSDTLFIDNLFFDWKYYEVPDQFVLKLDSLGTALSFSHTCDNCYSASASDFAVAQDEKYVVAGQYCHHGCKSTSMVFNELGQKISPPPGFNGGFAFVEKDAKVAIGDNNGFWSFVEEFHCTGPCDSPDSIWYFQSIIKQSFSHKLLLRDTFALPGKLRAIAADINGNIYIASDIAAGKTQMIQQTFLSSSSGTHPALYVAKFRDNGNYLQIAEQNQNEKLVRYYPNPAEGDVIVSTEADISIEISDIYGNRYGNYIVKAGTSELSLKNLIAGVYIITSIFESGLRVSQKVVLK